MYPPEEKKMVRLTLREEILELLKKEGAKNTSEIAMATKTSRQNVMDKLYLARRLGHVKDTFVHKELAWGGKVLTHVWMITSKGKTWIEEK